MVVFFEDNMYSKTKTIWEPGVKKIWGRYENFITLTVTPEKALKSKNFPQEMEKQRKAGPLYQENNIQIDVDVNKDNWCCQNSDIRK